MIRLLCHRNFTLNLRLRIDGGYVLPFPFYELEVWPLTKELDGHGQLAIFEM